MTRRRSSTSRTAEQEESPVESAIRKVTGQSTPVRVTRPSAGNSPTLKDTSRVPSVESPSPKRDSGHTEGRHIGKTERRYIVKPEQVGRRTLWGVYDRQRGCWPVTLAGFGRVKQDLDTEEEAQAEADRLEGTR